MAVTSKPLANAPVAPAADETSASPFRWWRGIAIVMWCVAVWLTSQNFPESWLAFGWAAALVMQGICTRLEAPLWNRERRLQLDAHDQIVLYERPQWRFFGPLVEVPDLLPVPWSAYAALVVGTATNLRGAWLLVQSIHTWEPVQVVLEIFRLPALSPLTGWSALAACCMIGIVVEALPELLWQAD